MVTIPNPDDGEHDPFPNGHLERAPKRITWEGMQFRSKAEYVLTKAFDEHNVWVMPNVRGRVGMGPSRCTREIDLLLNIDGWWTAVEVDGSPYHPASRAATDHERDRLFRRHGITHVERYDADRVRAEPYKIVAETVAMAEALRRALGR